MPVYIQYFNPNPNSVTQRQVRNLKFYTRIFHANPIKARKAGDKRPIINFYSKKFLSNNLPAQEIRQEQLSEGHQHIYMPGNISRRR